MPRIIFLNVDGTVVDYSNHLPASAVTAIRQARRAGHLVYLTTGRSRAEMYQELWDIGIDGIIGGNGSYVEHHGEVVMHQTLSQDECVAVVDWLRGRGLAFYLEANSGLYGSEGFEVAALPAVRAYIVGKGATDSATRTVGEVFPHMIYGADLYRDDINKISFVLGSDQDFLDAQKTFLELKAGIWADAAPMLCLATLASPISTRPTPSTSCWVTWVPAGTTQSPWGMPLSTSPCWSTARWVSPWATPPTTSKPSRTTSPRTSTLMGSTQPLTAWDY